MRTYQPPHPPKKYEPFRLVGINGGRRYTPHEVRNNIVGTCPVCGGEIIKVSKEKETFGLPPGPMGPFEYFCGSCKIMYHKSIDE